MTTSPPTPAFGEPKIQQPHRRRRGAGLLVLVVLSLVLVVGGRGLVPPAGAQLRALEEAVAAYEEADFETALVILEALPEDLAPAERALALRTRALVLIGLGRTDEARTSFAELLAVSPDATLDPEIHAPHVLDVFGEARELAIEGRYDRAMAAYEAGRFGEAAEGFEAVAALDPDNRLARAFADLARSRTDEEEETEAGGDSGAIEPDCTPRRAWAFLETRSSSCESIEAVGTDELGLPAEVDRVTLIYTGFRDGPGGCFELALIRGERRDSEVVHSFKDLNRFDAVSTPEPEDRWITVDLPEPTTIDRVEMRAEGSTSMGRIVRSNASGPAWDSFLLILERTCSRDGGVTDRWGPEPAEDALSPRR